MIPLYLQKDLKISLKSNYQFMFSFLQLNIKINNGSKYFYIQNKEKTSIVFRFLKCNEKKIWKINS